MTWTINFLTQIVSPFFLDKKTRSECGLTMVNLGQNFKQWLKKTLILTWKDENSHLGKKLTWFDCGSTWSKIGKNGILVILTLNVKNKIIHYPIGINSVVLKKILRVP